MKLLKVYICLVITFSITSAMDNNSLVRRHMRIEEEHRVNGQIIRQYLEAGSEREIEQNAQSWKSTLLKNFLMSDLTKASIFLMVAGCTTWNSVTPSSTRSAHRTYNQTTMCPAWNCAAEKSAGFKDGMILCSLSMGALFCCNQCIKTCGDCNEQE